MNKSFPELLREAQEIVEGQFLFKKFIDGTPLSNDIAVWMAEFAQAAITASRTNDDAQPSSAAPVEGMDFDKYVPGVWKCHTCNFVQHRNILCPKGIYAETAILEEPCPNEGDVMFPMTWQEMAKENQEFGVRLLDEKEKLTAALAHERAVRKGLVEALKEIRAIGAPCDGEKASVKTKMAAIAHKALVPNCDNAQPEAL